MHNRIHMESNLFWEVHMHQVVRKNRNENANHSSQCLSQPTGRTGHSAGHPTPNFNKPNSVCHLCLAFPSSLAQSKDKRRSLSILTTQHTQALTVLLSKSSSSTKTGELGSCSNSHSQQGLGAQNAGAGLLANSTKSSARPSFLLCTGSKDRLSFATTQQRSCSHS